MHQKGSDPVWCGGLLERAAELAALDEALAAVRGSGQGRFVLLSGEAGIGKTSLLRAFCATHGDVATFRGGCDRAVHAAAACALYRTRGRRRRGLAARLSRGGDPGRGARDAGRGAAPAGSGAARARGPALGRRGHPRRRAPARAPARDRSGARRRARYRDDEFDRRPSAAARARRAAARRARRGSPCAAVGRRGRSARGRREDRRRDALHRRTGGNPFFVTEVLAAAAPTMPDDRARRGARPRRAARRAARARARRGRDRAAARRAVAARAVRRRGSRRASTSAWPSGMLQRRGCGVAFRHEIARFAVEESLPPRPAGRAAPRALCVALAPALPPDLARLAHHAEARRRRDAVLHCAPRRPSAPPLSAPIARRPRSSRARCACGRPAAASSARSC